jgi:hypothetical protein
MTYKLCDFEQYVIDAKDYWYNTAPDHKDEIDNYLEQLREAFNQYKTISSTTFKQIYLFLSALYNLFLYKIEENEDLKKYMAEIKWLQKDEPFNKLQQCLTYYTEELPDYKELFKVENDRLVTTATYTNLVNRLVNRTLDEELKQIVQDEKIRELMLDYAILNKFNVMIPEDTIMKNTVSYHEYLGLKKFLEDFSYLKDFLPKAMKI